MALITDILNQGKNPIAGNFLVSNLRLDGTLFERTVIYMSEYDEMGATGFIVNKPFGEIEFKKILTQMGLLADEFEQIQNIPIYYGGPVDVGKGYVLHSNDFHDKTTQDHKHDICITANTHILEKLALGEGPKESIFVLGHSSWGPGQLEREIEYNSWILVPAEHELILNHDCDEKWTTALDHFGIKKRRLFPFQGHA